MAEELTSRLDLDDNSYRVPYPFPSALVPIKDNATQRQAIVASMVFIHHTVRAANALLGRRQQKMNFVSPRHFLDFIQHYVTLFNEKRSELEDQQLHLNKGLAKLADTHEQVTQLNQTLTQTV